MKRFLLLCSLLLATGCSTFNRDWKAMEAEPVPPGLAGRWAGTWQSDENGHDGGLRCIIAESEDGGYTARYHATYGWCFTFEYTMPMAVEADGDVMRFSADADLGWLAGGRYEYAGSVEGDTFASTYACGRDHGTFTMERVRPDPPPAEEAGP